MNSFGHTVLIGHMTNSSRYVESNVLLFCFDEKWRARAAFSLHCHQMNFFVSLFAHFFLLDYVIRTQCKYAFSIL